MTDAKNEAAMTAEKIGSMVYQRGMSHRQFLAAMCERDRLLLAATRQSWEAERARLMKDLSDAQVECSKADNEYIGQRDRANALEDECAALLRRIETAHNIAIELAAKLVDSKRGAGSTDFRSLRDEIRDLKLVEKPHA